MKKILCSLIIIAQLVSCGRVSTPPDQNSGDTTQMDFETDGNGNIEVLVPDEQKDGDKDVGVGNDGNQSGGTGSSDFGGGGGFSIDLSGFFEGVGSFAGKVGGLVQAGIGEITGENKRKKKEAEKKAKEIEGLLGEVEDLKGEIRNRAKELEDSTNGIASTDFNGEKDTQDAINRRGKDHNRDVENTRNKLPELGTNPSSPLPSDNPYGRDPYPTPEKEKVRKTRDFLSGARKQVQENSSGDDRRVREGILDAADGATDSAEESYGRGDNIEGDWKLDLAKRLADLAVSSTPLLGDIYDIANALNGENFITGEPISPEEGIVQAANAILSLATGGGLGTIADAAKASKVLKEIAKKTAKRAAKKAGKDSLDPKKEKGIDEKFDKGERAGRNAGQGETAGEFEKSISKLPPGERVAAVRAKADKVAKSQGWEKNNNLSKKNNRTVYTDKDGNHWSVDTQHGQFEKLNSKGQHQGSFDMDLNSVPNKPADPSGGHDIFI